MVEKKKIREAELKDTHDTLEDLVFSDLDDDEEGKEEKEEEDEEEEEEDEEKEEKKEEKGSNITQGQKGIGKRGRGKGKRVPNKLQAKN